jgi:hypothetical protein
MSGCQLTESRVHGFVSVVLANDWLSVAMVPHLGSKLMSLYDRKHEYEWLWTNPLLTHLRPLSMTHTEQQFELGGWDECFPGLRAAPYPVPPWSAFHIPKYGDLWSHEWKKTTVENTSARIAICMSMEGRHLPYRFERTLALQAGEPILRFSYRLHNDSHVPMPFVWSSHPLLRAEPGMRVVLPEGTRTWLDSVLPAGTLDAGIVTDWPYLAVRKVERNLSEVLPDTEGWAAKLYTVGLTDGRVAVEHPARNRRLFFDFVLSDVSHAGVWLNYGGWGGLEMRPAYHLGVMPCIGGADDLQVAIQRGEYGVLPAAGEKTWELKVTLE